MDRKTLLELNVLSKEVYGTTGKWRKLMASGTKKAVEVKEGEKRHKNVRIYEVVQHTHESVRQYMLDIKAKRAEAKQKFEDEQKIRHQKSIGLSS